MARAVWKVRILEKAEFGGPAKHVCDSSGLQCTTGDGYAQVWLRMRGGKATGR